jgi:hypothetical protein
VLLQKHLFIGMIVLGALTSVSGMLGLFAARGNPRKGQVKVFFVCVFLLFITQVVLASQMYVEKDKLPTLVPQGWSQASDAVRAAIQTRFQCCGFSATSDGPAQPCEYKIACSEPILAFFKNQAMAVIITAFAITAIHVSALALSGLVLATTYGPLPTILDDDGDTDPLVAAGRSSAYKPVRRYS